MKIKDKLLNAIADRLADKLKEYKKTEYDIILSCYVKAKVKGSFMTTDCTTVKELPEKSQDGIIDIVKLLESEFHNIDTYHRNSIIFCDKDMVACIHNSINNSYYESTHEFFEEAEKRVYINFDNYNDYQTFKNFVNQSSKYHNFVEFKDEIPRKEAFDIIFSKNENTTEKNIIDSMRENNMKEIIIDSKGENNIEENTKNHSNYVEMIGKISNIGKKFKKIDGEYAQFIDIEQEYDYNGKNQKNIISVMLEGKILSINEELLKLNLDVDIKGKLSVYTDKNMQNKSVINCNNLEILNKKQDKNIEK